MATKQVALADASTSSKLALIYSRLAELEIQREKRSNVWDEVVKRFSASDLDALEIANIEDIFKDATGSLMNVTFAEGSREDASIPSASSADAAESISRIRMLFLAEQQFSETLQSSLQEKIKRVNAFQSERDGHASEMFRIREEMMKLDVRTHDLEELCRNLQKLAREKDEQRQQLVEQERSKSEHLEAECLQSISAVTKKIEQEELDLAQKDQENQSLKEKLEEFMQHINLRKEKRQNEVKAQELQRRLQEARKAQAVYIQEQEKLRLHTRKSKIHQLEETVYSLRRQLGTYAEKFEEFEDTLDRSTEVLEKINEREKSLGAILDRLKEEQSVLKSRAAETDVGVIVALEQKRVVEGEVVSLKVNYEKLEKKCRKLLARRQELMKLKEKANADQIQRVNPTSSSASSSASAVPSSSSSARGSSHSQPSSRVKTPSPTQEINTPAATSTVPVTSSSALLSTPTRKGHQFVASSSSMTSPSRPLPAEQSLVGEGSPVSSPNLSLRKQQREMEASHK